MSVARRPSISGSAKVEGRRATDMAALSEQGLKLCVRRATSRSARPRKSPPTPVGTSRDARASAMNSTSVVAVEMPLDHAAVRTIVVGILLAMLLGALDQTIVATALPTIGRELENVQDLSWVVTSYLLTATAATPLYGKLSDIHGRRAMLLVAIGVFALGSVASAMAPTMAVLILARGLQGLG